MRYLTVTLAALVLGTILVYTILYFVYMPITTVVDMYSRL